MVCVEVSEKNEGKKNNSTQLEEERRAQNRSAHIFMCRMYGCGRTKSRMICASLLIDDDD